MDITKMSPDLQKKIVDMVVDRKNYCKNAKPYIHFNDKFPKLYNAYKGIFTTSEKRQWRSKLFVMVTFTTIETIKATLMQLLFKSEQWQRIKASETTNPIKELAMQSIMDMNLKKIKAKSKYMFETLNQAAKYGTAFTRTFWDYKTMIKTKRFPKKVGGNIIGSEKTASREIIADYANFRTMNPLLTYVDPKATSLNYPDGCRFIIEDAPLDVNQIKMYGKTGFFQNIDQIETKDKNGNTYPIDTMADLKFVTPDGESEFADQYRNRIVVSCYNGKLDLPEFDGDDRPYEIMIANDHTLIHLDIPFDHGSLPIQIHRMIPEENRLYGIGVIETILADQYFMNQIVNQRLDNVNLLLNQGFILNEMAFENPDEIIEQQPGFIVRANGMVGGDLYNSIKPLPIQDSTGGTFEQMTNWLDRNKQKTSGATDFTAGMIPQSGVNQTATGVATLMEQANKRFGSMLFSLSDGMDELLMSLMHLNQQFISSERILKIAGKKISLKIKPNDFEGEYELEAMNTSGMTNDILAQLNINFLTAMSPYVQPMREMGYDLNLPQILNEIVSIFPGLSQRRNIIKKMATPQPVPGMQPAPGAQGAGGAAPVQQILEQMAAAGG